MLPQKREDALLQADVCIAILMHLWTDLLACLPGWLAGLLKDRLTNREVDKARLTDGWSDRLFGSPTVGCLTGMQAGKLADGRMDRRADGLAGWLAGWPASKTRQKTSRQIGENTLADRRTSDGPASSVVGRPMSRQTNRQTDRTG